MRTWNGPLAAACPRSSLPSQASFCASPGLRGAGGGFGPPSTPAARLRTTCPLESRTATSTSVAALTSNETKVTSPERVTSGGARNSTFAADRGGVVKQRRKRDADRSVMEAVSRGGPCGGHLIPTPGGKASD